jgi:hypothetical protein
LTGDKELIIGAHAVISSKNAAADREFMSRKLHLASVDAGGGWLIFSLPPSEFAFHPSTRNSRQELYLLCEDVAEFIAEMKREGVRCGTVQRQAWGLLTSITLPSGGKIRVYQPLHKRPNPLRQTGKRGKLGGSSRTGRVKKDL